MQRTLLIVLATAVVAAGHRRRRHDRPDRGRRPCGLVTGDPDADTIGDDRSDDANTDEFRRGVANIVLDDSRVGCTGRDRRR